jgi:large subunit ribosomal protein L5
MVRMKELYLKKVAKDLGDKFEHKNVHSIPKITKVVVNAGVGRASLDSKHLDTAIEVMKKVTGQAPVITKAKKSIAGFKLREKMNIGTVVTLRGDRMYEFLDRLVNVALPRVRDFRGLNPKAFDGKGNYSLGLRDHGVFPEISFEEASSPVSLQVNVTTTAKNDEEALALLSGLGFPFKN